MRFRDPCHVVYVTTSFPTLENPTAGLFVADLAERVAASGWRVTVLAPIRDGDQLCTRPGVHSEGITTSLLDPIGARESLVGSLRRTPTRVVHLPKLAWRLRRALEERAPDAALIHAHWLPSAMLMRGMDRPIVVTAHGSDITLGLRSTRATRALLSADAVIVGTNAAAAQVRALTDARIEVIAPVGFEHEPERFADAEPMTAIFVGRLSEEKGIAELASAWSQVTSEVPEARLHIVGDGPLRGLLAAPTIVHHGTQLPEAVRRLRAQTAFAVQSSLREGFGVAALESIASGRGIVATQTGVAPELLAESGAAVLVPSGDVDALARELKRLLATPEPAASMAIAATACALPAWSDITSATVSLYSTLSAVS